MERGPVMLADTDVTTALIVAFSTIAVACVTAIPAVIAAVNSRRTHKMVGDANGNGTLAGMAERTLGNTTEVLGWQSQHEQSDAHRFGIVDVRLGGIEDRLGVARGEAIDGGEHL